MATLQLAPCSIHVRDHDGQIEDTAFDITTADTFFSGIASRIIERDSVLRAFDRILRDVRLNGTCWALQDGRAVDRSEHPEALRHAQLVDVCRRECARHLGLA